MNETFDDMAKEVMRKIQRSDKHAFMVIRAALRKAYAEGEKDAQQSVQPTASGAGGRGQNSLQSSFIADESSAKHGGR